MVPVRRVSARRSVQKDCVVDFTLVLACSAVSLQNTGRFPVEFCTSSVDSSITSGCSPSCVCSLLKDKIKYKVLFYRNAVYIDQVHRSMFTFWSSRSNYRKYQPGITKYELDLNVYIQHYQSWSGAQKHLSVYIKTKQM